MLKMLPALMLVLSQPGSPDQEQTRIVAAAAKGVEWLLTQRSEILKAAAADSRSGGLELLVWTLASQGVPESSREMSELIEAMTRRSPETTRVASLQALTYRKLDPVRYSSELVRCAQYLVDAQCENGQWGESRAHSVERHPGKPPRRAGQALGGRSPSAKEDPVVIVRRAPQAAKSGDNSNSLAAAFGLRACMESGLFFEREMLVRARMWWNRSQRTDGGWGAEREREEDTEDTSTGDMTAGAVAATCIYKHFLGEDYARNPSVLRGWAWLRKEYSIKENPGLGNVAHFSYLLSLERAGILLGKEALEEHSWYSEGCEFLIGKQESDGRWNARDLRVRDVCENTCTAVLFLMRDADPLPPPVRLPAPPHPEEK